MTRAGQEAIGISVWGLIMTRGDEVLRIELFAELVEPAVVGGSAALTQERRDPEVAAYVGQERHWARDDFGDVAVRALYVEDVLVRRTEVLYAEANRLAEAVATMLDHWDRRPQDARQMRDIEPHQRVRDALAAYDARWTPSRNSG